MRPSCSTRDTGIKRPAFSVPIAEPDTAIVNAASFDAAQSLVFRRIQKMQKPTSGRRFPCFCCLCGKLSANNIAFPAEILG
jgi:hypothetical protein